MSIHSKPETRAKRAIKRYTGNSPKGYVMDAIERAANQVRDNLHQVRSRLHADRLGSLRYDVSRALARAPVVPVSVYLFGSWANGTFDGQSDIDLLIIAQNAMLANAAEQRLMPLADDVVAMTETQWLRRLASTDLFVTRVADERLLLVHGARDTS